MDATGNQLRLGIETRDNITQQMSDVLRGKSFRIWKVHPQRGCIGITPEPVRLFSQNSVMSKAVQGKVELAIRYTEPEKALTQDFTITSYPKTLVQVDSNVINVTVQLPGREPKFNFYSITIE